MTTMRDEYELDFDPVYEFRNAQGHRQSRFFRHNPIKKLAHFSPAPVTGAASSGLPLILAIVLGTIFILGLVIAIPLVIVFGIVPNTGTNVVTTVAPTIPRGPSAGIPIPNVPDPPPQTEVLKMLCPGNVIKETDEGQSQATVIWASPTVLSETDGQPQLTPSILPNSRFSIGTHQVLYSATDNGGNTGTCSFTVTIIDEEPPSLECPPDMTVPTDPYSISAKVYWPTPTFDDNSGNVNVHEVTDEPGDQFHVGSHIVTIIVRDDSSNDNRCSFLVVVEDREPPRLTCPDIVVAYTNAPLTGTAAASWAEPGVQENSLKAPPGATCSPASGSSFSFGDTDVTCAATDEAGNEGVCQFQVSVRFNDTEPPVWTGCPSDVEEKTATSSARAFVSWTPPTAEDNSLEELDVALNLQPDQNYDIGTYEVVYTVTDAAGLKAYCRFTVEVRDEEDPTFTVPDNVKVETDNGRSYATVTLPDPTNLADNSGGPVDVTKSQQSGTEFGIGETPVDYTVEDVYGNSVAFTITVTVEDKEAPTFTEIADFLLNVQNGESTADVILPWPDNLRDNSGDDVTVRTSITNGTALEIGPHDVTYTVEDVYGNTDMFTVTVTIGDNQAPQFTEVGDFEAETDSGEAFATVSFPDPADLSDNSGQTPTVSTSPESGAELDIGPNTVTYTVSDGNGNSAVFDVIVTVIDREDPTFTEVDDFEVTTDPDQSVGTVIAFPQPTDLADNSGEGVTVSTSLSDGVELEIGPHTVTYTVEDAHGNSVDFDVTVTVLDNQDPTIVCPAGFTENTDATLPTASVEFPQATGSDNSQTPLTFTTDPESPAILAIGPHTVTYTVTDASSLSATCSIEVTIIDEEKPVLVCPDDISEDTDNNQAYATVTYNVIMPSDNDGDDPTLTPDPNPIGGQFNIGETEVELTAVDGSGNSISCSFKITVNDREDPTFTEVDDFEVTTDLDQSVGTVNPFPQPTDLADNSGEGVTVSTSLSDGVELEIGPYTVTYTVEDAHGNSVDFDVTVTVLDNQDPTIVCPASFTENTDATLPTASVDLPQATISDNSETPLALTTDPESPAVLAIGPHTVTYTVTDASSLSATCSIEVTIIDEEKPVLVCPDDISEDTDNNQAYATVTYNVIMPSDNDGDDPTLTPDPNPIGGQFNIGETEVELTAVDGSGNSISCSFKITVNDREDPTFTEVDDFEVTTDLDQSVGTVNPFPQPTDLADNSGEGVTVSTSPSDGVELEIGPHTVTYTVEDAHGNSVDFDVTVTVLDNQDPTIVCPASFTENTDATLPTASVDLPQATISDNSETPLALTTDPESPAVLAIGPHTVTYTVTDASSLSATCSIEVTIIDEEKPVLVCPDDISEDTDNNQAYATVTYNVIMPSDNDGDDPTLTPDPNPIGGQFNLGETEVELTAVDGSGNSISCSFKITVNDRQEPDLTCPNEVDVYSDALTLPMTFSATAIWTVAITDNSGEPLVGVQTTHPPGSLFQSPSTTVTYTAEDAYTNVGMCSFPVNVMGFLNTDCSTEASTLDLNDLTGTGVKYHLLSPGRDVGDPYPSNTECLWNLVVPTGKYVRIAFREFDTEADKDFLYLGQGQDAGLVETSLASFSGSMVALADGTAHTKDWIHQADNVWMRFSSSASHTQGHPGFWLEIDVVDNPRSLFSTAYSFCSTFGGFPCPDSECIDMTQRCDGTNDCQGSEDELNCPTACNPPLHDVNVDFPATSGVFDVDIVSNNYPAEYPPCNVKWIIDDNLVSSIRVVVMDIQMDAGDRLYFEDRDTGVAVTSDIESLVNLHLNTGSSFNLVFVSGGGTGRGFWIKVWRYIDGLSDFPLYASYCEHALHSLSCGAGSCLLDSNRCNDQINCDVYSNDEMKCENDAYDCGTTNINLDGAGSMHHLTSVNYPADFFADVTCEYTVTTTAATILISFRDVELPNINDYLSIRDGGNVAATELVRLNGVFLPNDVESSGNQLWIQFVTNSIYNTRGFWIVLVAQGS